MAPPGHVILSVDLSQAESWIVGYLAQDENMITALKNGILHETTARRLFDLNDWSIPVPDEYRYVGKRTNHGTGYRMTPERFVEEYNLESPDGRVISIATGRKWQNIWHSTYPNVKNNWWNEIDFKLKTQDSTLTTVYGFTRKFFGPDSNEKKKEATAFEPQSTVADHFNGEVQEGNEIPGGLLEFNLQKPPEVKIINQSHDSFMAEVPKAIYMDMYYLAKKLFYRPIIIKGQECWIPVDGEVGERWKEMEKIKG